MISRQHQLPRLRPGLVVAGGIQYSARARIEAPERYNRARAPTAAARGGLPIRPDLVNMFAVPFAFSRYPDPARLNAALRALVLAKEKRGEANPRPLTYRNPSLFESHFDLFRDPDAAVQELKRFCWDQMLAVIGTLNGYDLPTLERLQIYNDCWFHVTRRGGFFGLHNHPNASWSGVYCVDPGRHDPDKKMSGVLSFVNPMIMNSMHMDAGVARMQLPYAHHVANFSLEPGQLVLFPSWVLHDVKPFEGEGERITIAFNCWFNLPDASTAGPSAPQSP